MKRAILSAPIAFAVLASLAACSENTQDAAQETAARAAADTKANAEVVGDDLRKGAIVAADKVSEGAADLRNDMVEDDRNAPPNDGELDGTD